MNPLVRIDCKHAHGLLSEAMDHKLTPWTQLRLQLHLSICHACSRVDQQFQQMRSVIRRLGQ